MDTCCDLSAVDNVKVVLSCQATGFLTGGIQVVFKSEKNLKKWNEFAGFQMFSVLDFFPPEQIDGACKVISAKIHVIRPFNDSSYIER